jgi:hypothetical protein
MELLLLILAVCLIGILATRFGYDSTAVPHSSEHHLASYGVVWEMHHGQLEDLRREARVWRLLREGTPRSARSKRLRRRLAAVLRGLAQWLSPEPAHPSEGGVRVLFRAPGP